MTMATVKRLLLIVPECAPGRNKSHPGGVKPGAYARDGLVRLLREHRGDPQAVRFIADMLEE